MKKSAAVLSFLLLAAPAAMYATDQLIPAGSTVSCRVAEGKISSKTTAIGDPVLCTLNPVEVYGRSVFPYGSYLAGHFEDYKDPGHFVGKGWMELKFDRMYIGNRVLPITAKVVQVPKYNVDRDGRILGNGHAVKDTVEWLIPLLWPIDLINLPRRGPRPVLQPETKLTLELLEDIGIPDVDQPRDQQYPQQRVPLQQYAQQQPAPQQQQAPATVIYQSFNQAPAPIERQAPQVVYQQAPPQQTVVVQAPPQVVYRYAPLPPPVYVYPPAYRYYGPGY